MSAEVIPLPTLEILQNARAVITRPDGYDEDVVLTAIQTLLWRGNWIDQDRARMLLRAMQDQKMRRWLAEKDAAEKAALKAKRTERLRSFNRQVLVPGLWLACGFAAAALLMWATTAKAHDAPAGWAYDSKCCTGQDCTEVPDGRVTAGPDGWRIALEPGDHPFAPNGFHGTLPYGDVRNRVSGDAHFHVCLGPTLHIRCVYSPPMGM